MGPSSANAVPASSCEEGSSLSQAVFTTTVWGKSSFDMSVDFHSLSTHPPHGYGILFIRRHRLGRMNFDWRWIVLVVLALMFFGQFSLRVSPVASGLLLALGGCWAIMVGLEPWRRGRGALLGNTKVTYWRGQRIEMRQPGRARLRTPPTTSLIVSILYLVVGVGLVLGAVFQVLPLFIP